MKTSPGARSWIAAGVRHELLTRALPALRHDMAAPVSVMRMGLLMLRRQVASKTIDPVACEERVALIDNQIGELIGAVRSLRDWELATEDDGITRSMLVSQCANLMRAAFDMHGVRLNVDEALDGPSPTGPDAGTSPSEVRRSSGAALRYLLLGVLGYLHDTVPDVGAIAVTADGDDALLVTATAGAGEMPQPIARAHRAPRALAIDAIALQSLAEDMGYVVAIERNVVRLPLSTG